MAEPEIVIRQRFGGEHVRERWRHSLWVLPLATVGFARLDLHEALWIAIGTAAAGSALLLLTAVVLRHATLRIAGETIHRTSWLVGPRTCLRSDVARVVELELLFTPIGFPEKFVLFVDRDDRTLMRAYAGYYPYGELERFAAALDVPWERVPLPLKPKQARRELPGSFPWPWAHWVLTFLALLVLTYIGAIVVLTIVYAVS